MQCSTAEGIRLTLDETRNTCSKISEMVDRTHDIKLEETKSKLKWDCDISRIDGNMLTISERVESNERWATIEYNEAVNKRLSIWC